MYSTTLYGSNCLFLQMSNSPSAASKVPSTAERTSSCDCIGYQGAKCQVSLRDTLCSSTRKSSPLLTQVHGDRIQEVR